MKKKIPTFIKVLLIIIIIAAIIAGGYFYYIDSKQKKYEANFKSTIKTYKETYSKKLEEEQLKNPLMDKNINLAGEELKKYIPEINSYFLDKLKIENGNLIFVGTIPLEKNMAKEQGVLDFSKIEFMQEFTKKIEINTDFDIKEIVTNNAGETILVGSIVSEKDSKKEYTPYMVKYNSEYAKVVEKSFDKTGNETYIYDIVMDADETMYIVGNFTGKSETFGEAKGNSDAYIAKIDSNLNIVSKQVYSQNKKDNFKEILIENGENILALGETDSDMPGRKAEQDILMVRYSKTLEKTWEKVFSEGKGYSTIEDSILAEEGKYIICGANKQKDISKGMVAIFANDGTLLFRSLEEKEINKDQVNTYISKMYPAKDGEFLILKNVVDSKGKNATYVKKLAKNGDVKYNKEINIGQDKITNNLVRIEDKFFVQTQKITKLNDKDVKVISIVKYNMQDGKELANQVIPLENVDIITTFSKTQGLETILKGTEKVDVVRYKI